MKTVIAFFLVCAAVVHSIPQRRGLVTDVVIKVGGKVLKDVIISAFGKKETVTITPNNGSPVDCEVEWKWRISKWELVYDAEAKCPGATEKSKGRSSKANAIVQSLCAVSKTLYGSGVTVNYGDKSCTTRY